MMQSEIESLIVKVMIKMIDAVGVEKRRAALDAVDGVPLVQQKLGQVGAILSRNSRD